MTREKAKTMYWKHFLNNEKYWAHGVTRKRLEKIKDTIWSDKDFWWDILDRHDCQQYPPITFKEIHPLQYQHMIGNFAGMISQTMMEQGLIKP